ncbi:MAG: hypothetical protein ACLP2P_15210 [Desulfobaccales bacterium]
MNLPGPISFFEVMILVAFIAASIAIIITTLILLLRKRNTKSVRFDPIHISDLIKLIVSVASFVTVCVTLFFIVLQNRTIVMQTKYNLESVESNVFGTMTSQSLASDDVFLRNPELRPYFYSGKALIKNDPLADKVKSVAEFYLDYFESLSTQLRKYPNIWRFEKNAWEANIIDMFAWSPVLCQYLEVNKEWYGEELMGLKKKGEAKRRQGYAKQPF